MKYLEKTTETLPREALELLQIEKLSYMLEKIYGQNSFYTKKINVSGFNRKELKTLADLKSFPLTTKTELMDAQLEAHPFGANTTYEQGAYTRFHQTSGTTGTPLRVFDTPESWEWWGNCWGYVLKGAGLTENDRLSVPFSFGPFIGFWAAVEGARKIKSLLIPGGGKDSFQRLQLMKELEATVICCTPTYALRLVDVAREYDFDLRDIPIRKLILAGEPGASVPSTKARIECFWDAKCFDHAGASEIGAHSFECEIQPNGMHVIESEFIVEVINPKNHEKVAMGDIGELVITNLGRIGYPVIRYRSGDLVRLNNEVCDCGRTFSLMKGGVLGRVDDMFVVRGINVFPSAIENIINECDSVKEFRVVVSSEREMANLTVELEIEDNSTQLNVINTVNLALRNKLGLSSEVVEVPSGSIPRYEMKSKRFHIKDKN